jgi:ACR3 family arsenite transporter
VFPEGFPLADQPWLILLAFVIVMVASIVQAGLGMGFGLTASPLLALIDPHLVPVPTLIMGMVTAGLGGWRERGSIIWPEVGIGMAGRLVGVACGALVLSLLVDRKAFMLVFGIMVGVAVLLSLSGWRWKFSTSSLVAMGWLSGLMGTITSVGAPPLALIYQDRQPAGRAADAVGVLRTRLRRVAGGAGADRLGPSGRSPHRAGHGSADAGRRLRGTTYRRASRQAFPSSVDGDFRHCRIDPDCPRADVMGALRTLLLATARHGRLVLIAGLVVGILFPGLAGMVRGVLPELVACMLGVAALRIGPTAARGSLADIHVSLRLVAAYQLLLPLVLAAVFLAFGLGGTLATAMVLMAAAPSISGSPNLTIMTGHDPAPALRLMIAGVALLPLTVAPVFLLWPIFGSFGAIALASGKLLLLIGCSSAAAFVIRKRFFPKPGVETLGVIDGVSALLMAVLVIGLMSALGPAIIQTPGLVGLTLLAAFAINFSLQIAAFILTGGRGHERSRVAWSIIAGNRNIALFLVALPAAITDPLLLFIGCYQIPMYLTPILLRPLYAGRMQPL